MHRHQMQDLLTLSEEGSGLRGRPYSRFTDGEAEAGGMKGSSSPNASGWWAGCPSGLPPAHRLGPGLAQPPRTTWPHDSSLSRPSAPPQQRPCPHSELTPISQAVSRARSAHHSRMCRLLCAWGERVWHRQRRRCGSRGPGLPLSGRKSQDWGAGAPSNGPGDARACLSPGAWASGWELSREPGRRGC